MYCMLTVVNTYIVSLKVAKKEIFSSQKNFESYVVTQFIVVIISQFLHISYHFFA